jgi:hypothetical protein
MIDSETIGGASADRFALSERKQSAYYTGQ